MGLLQTCCECKCAIAWNGRYLPKTANAPKTFAHLFMRRIELHNNVNACLTHSFSCVYVERQISSYV